METKTRGGRTGSVVGALGMLAAVGALLTATPAMASSDSDRSGSDAGSAAAAVQRGATPASGQPGKLVPAPSAAAEIDEAGTWAIWNGLSLGPGASAVGGWNNTPAGVSYFVDVRPSATTVTTACQLQVVRDWRVQHWNANNTRELEVWWEVKNVGTAACKGDVYLGFVR